MTSRASLTVFPKLQNRRGAESGLEIEMAIYGRIYAAQRAEVRSASSHVTLHCLKSRDVL